MINQEHNYYFNPNTKAAIIGWYRNGAYIDEIIRWCGLHENIIQQMIDTHLLKENQPPRHK